MKFVDETTIIVKAGNGGSGCMSFRREKYIELGGPNGGDGGDGGGVYLIGDRNINTLVDFRHARVFSAKNGRPGKGDKCTGARGDDRLIMVPLGTIVRDLHTNEIIADISKAGEKVIMARGGFHGLGNVRFKSSTNRAPRQITKGSEGEMRELVLELKLLADVGLLGMPNAGKSTLITTISSARPKVANYPFTTLYPNLGVVKVGDYRSFVVADIPGLIEGAAEGHGLGIQFLKHLERTHFMLHMVDIAPFDDTDPADSILKIAAELAKYSPELAQRERWLVINKVDMLDNDEAEERCQALIDELNWTGPVFKISALAGTGTQDLCNKIMKKLETIKAAEIAEEEAIEHKATSSDTPIIQ